MSRIGLNRGFTLIEVFAAIMILSVGIIGVIRAYITLANGIEASAFTVQASYLLKTEMAEVEKEAIENPGIFAGTKSGSFGPEYPGFRWEYTASDVLMGTLNKTKEAVAPADADATAAKNAAKSATSAKTTEVVLSKIRLSVTSGNASERMRKLGLWTYLENPGVSE